MNLINELLQIAGCELLDEEKLNETKPARYLSHLDKSKSFANLTAERNNPLYEPIDGDAPSINSYKNKMKQNQSAENNRRITELKSDLRKLGLSFIKTYGNWNENGKQTREQSFLIPNITKEQALALGKNTVNIALYLKTKRMIQHICTLLSITKNLAKKIWRLICPSPQNFRKLKNHRQKINAKLPQAYEITQVLLG